MYFWNTYPFVRLSIALISGILCYDYFPDGWQYCFLVFGVLLGLKSIAIAIASKYGHFKNRLLTGTLGLLLIFLLGGWLSKIHNDSYPQNHYKNMDDWVTAYQGTIVSPAVENADYHRYEFRLQHIISDTIKPIKGIIFLYIKKDTLSKRLYYGDVLGVKGSIFSIPPPKNPEGFNYKKFLERQHILAQSFVSQTEVKKIGHQPPSDILSFAFMLRREASIIIDHTIKGKNENAIAKALLLGVKDHLNNEIKRDYSSAGAMHVLAVSGLHVGIIYLLFSIIFGRIKDSGKIGKGLFIVSSILIIWLYAFITGLSPSVLRAAVMFSMISLGQAYAQKGNIYNTLGAAAFILMVYDPNLIYSVGFQLSFSAVLGIVYLQPKLYRVFQFRSLVSDKAWSITCVSIAAQVATFPLSIYYFHQFPTYFLLSNLVVIFAAFLGLLIGATMLIVYPILAIVGELLGQTLEILFLGLNYLMSVVGYLPYSLIEWLFIDRFELIITYLSIILFMLIIQKKSFTRVSLFFSAIILGMIYHSYSLFKQSKKEEVIFYTIKDNIAIDYIKGFSSTLFLEKVDRESLDLSAYQINPYHRASHLSPIKETIQSIKTESNAIVPLKVGSHQIILFDSTTFHLEFSSRIRCDLIYIENEAVKSLQWLNQKFDFDLIVLGTKNTWYYANKIKKQATEIDLEIHDLKNDGALVLASKQKSPY